MRGSAHFLTLILLLAGAAYSASAQSPADVSRRRIDSMARVDGFMRLDTHRLDIKVDGRNHAVKVVAYMAGGQIFIKGDWVNDPKARYGAEGILSSCVIRVPATPGEHRIVVDTMKRMQGAQSFDRQFDTARAPFFTAMYSGEMKDGRAFAIYRSDWNGGQGSITISSIASDGVHGRFTLSTYNERDLRDVKQVSGEFLLPLQRWGNEHYAANEQQ